MSTDITTRKRMSKYKESKTNTNVEIIRWESYMITYICVIEQLIKVTILFSATPILSAVFQPIK